MLAKEKSINLKIELPESLDPVYSDTDLFAQVLTNLLSNALRYAKSTITIAAQNVDKANYPFLIDIGDDTPIHQEGVRLSVQDDGIGIPQAYLTKIFDKFVQVNRPSGGDGYKGTGLGLAICKKIVDLHHGRIWVENLPEGGAIFHVFIPIYNEQADFIAALKEMVEESKKINTSLSMVVVRITNMDNIRKKCTPDLIDKLFLKLKDELQVRILRKSDQLFHQPTKDLLIILALTGHDGAQSICRRTLELISIFVAKQKDPNFDPTIKTGFATYPEDTDQSRSLLEKALANIK